MASAFTQAASLSGAFDGIQSREGNAIAAAIVGGSASVLGGGKFANGAITGAFSRMFNDLFVVINNNSPITGAHAGLVVGEGRSAVLYDPGGSYRNSDKGSGDALYGKDANLEAFVDYQKKDGSNVQVYKFKTTSEQDQIFKSRIENGGINIPFSCTLDVSSVLKGVGPFIKLGTSITPRGLGNDLKVLKP
jgi:hypothetical protein